MERAAVAGAVVLAPFTCLLLAYIREGQSDVALIESTLDLLLEVDRKSLGKSKSLEIKPEYEHGQRVEVDGNDISLFDHRWGTPSVVFGFLSGESNSGGPHLTL
jgi:hypothetical protein